MTNELKDIKPRYRRGLFWISGKVIKRGAGWILIEEDFEKYIWHAKNKDTGETESFEEHPFRVLICFPRDMGDKLESKGTWTNLDAPKVFTVTVGADLNQKTGKYEPKYWLDNVTTVEEFIKRING